MLFVPQSGFKPVDRVALPWLQRLLLFIAVCLSSQAASIRFNEIFHQPPSGQADEEWLELINSSTNTVDLSGWQLTRGVRFTFPPGTQLGPAAHLVVAANASSFTNRHPDVTLFLAGWDGVLSNSGETLALSDASGRVIDEVTYADEGDWSQRRRSPVDFGHRGWHWDNPAHGGGHSLELRQPRLETDHGQNWAASLHPGGTPGTPNSQAVTNLPPLLLDARHQPLVPIPTQPISVSVRLLDEQPSALSTVTLHWRRDGDLLTNDLPMLDDGLNGDGTALDQRFGAVIPPQPDGTVVEFWFTAEDAQGNRRLWPGPPAPEDLPTDALNCLFQVDATANPAPIRPDELPEYRLILRAIDRASLAQINRGSPAAPFPQPPPFSDQTRSHARFNGTFIARHGTGTALRYLVGVRNRGNGSRFRFPPSLRLDLRTDEPWQDQVALNLNSQFTPAQLLGTALYQRAGLATPNSRPVQVIVNNSRLATSGTSNHGFYVANEVVDSRFADRVFPSDSSGNLYRGIRITGLGANLAFLGDLPDPYRLNYFKRSNTAVDDWTDLIGLCRVLSRPVDDTWPDAVRANLDVEQWMLYFALETLVDNRETNLANANNGTGAGDDYSLYFGREDPRSRVFPHDLDTILGVGDSPFDPDAGLFRMTPNPQLARFIQHPEFVPLYFKTLLRLAHHDFHPDHFNPFVEEILGNRTPESVRLTLKNFAAARRASVLSQIPQTLTVTPSLPLLDGLPRAETNSIALGGFAPAATTRRVTVNGLPTTWTAWQATWTNHAFQLQPGFNRLRIQAWDIDDQEVALLDHAVMFLTGPGQEVGGDIIHPTRWTPADGPYRVTTSLTVTGQLIIEAGTTIELAPATSLTVATSGTLLVEGTDVRPVRITTIPGQAPWNGWIIRGKASITHTDFAGNGTTALRVPGGELVLDHCTFATPTHQYLSLDTASFLISHCHFPTPSAAFEPLHGRGGIRPGGHGILRHSYIGAPRGYNDAFDFTGGNRPGQPLLHVINNVFAGSGDDLLDLDGTDAWVEGNIFLNVHRNDSPDSASAVSGGNNGSATSEITILRNLFFNCDHAVTAKQRNFYALFHNTIVRITQVGGIDDASAVFNLADANTTAGRGLHLEGNVISHIDALARNLDPALSTVTLRDNVLPQPWTGPGSGNRVDSPLFLHLPSPAETAFTNWESAQLLRHWLRQSPGSTTRAWTGADRPPGPVLTGLPVSPTHRTHATFHVGPFVQDAGFPRFQWRLDQGPWSDWIHSSSSIALTDLIDGPHTVEVIAENDAGLTSNDPRLGPDAHISRHSWIVDRSRHPLRISEILARNSSIAVTSTGFPDWIELHLDADTPLDLAGYGLGKDPHRAPTFIFPPGTLVPANGRRVFIADNPSPPEANHLGFALNGSGDQLVLFNPDGQPIDSIAFGHQLPDRSIGRDHLGEWTLCIPTPGSENQPAALAHTEGLRINEWLAAPSTRFTDDFIELFNPHDHPIPIGGLLLTDNPVGQPGRHTLPPLGFIDARGFLTLIADGNPERGADHLGFRLASEGGAIQIADPSQNPTRIYDLILYGSQSTDISQGRSPDASSRLRFFTTPTPGTGNPVIPDPGQLLPPVLNEILPRNFSRVEPTLGTFAWVELFNPNEAPLDLQGISIGRTPTQAELTFNLSLILPPRGFQRVFFIPTPDPHLHPQPILPTPHTPTALSGSGDALYLFDTPARGRALIDAVIFGFLPRDLSLARVPDGSGPWLLAEPTPDAPNRATPLGDPSTIRINEWMADPVAGEDWFELFNPSTLPIDISGFHLTDRFDDPTRHTLPPHCFLGTGSEAHRRIDASGQSSLIDATQVSFRLARQGEDIALFNPFGDLIDLVRFSSQQTGVSEGRLPDGANLIARFPTLPTPGSANLIDSDLDGLPDDWERLHRLDPESAGDARLDSDLDGLSNRDEFHAGTDPRDPASNLALHLRSPPDGILLDLITQPDVTYHIESAPSLDPTAFEPFATIRGPHQPEPITFRAPDPGESLRFYRIRIRNR